MIELYSEKYMRNGEKSRGNCRDGAISLHVINDPTCIIEQVCLNRRQAVGFSECTVTLECPSGNEDFVQNQGMHKIYSQASI